MHGRLVGDVLEALDSGLKRALRLTVQGISDIGGPYPRSLLPGVEYILDSVDHHPSALQLQVPQLTDVLVEDGFSGDVPPNTSALGLFAQGMRDAIDGNEASELVDGNMIKSFLELGQVVDRVGAISLKNGKPGAVPVVLQETTLQQILEYKIEAPVSRIVRVSGRVNAIRHNDQSFSLNLESGHALRGTYLGGEADSLGQFYGQTVIATGVVHFRNSGRPSHLEARAIALATADEAALWAADPAPLQGTGSARTRTETQGPRSGLNAVYGKWPIEMSDADFLKRTRDE